MALPKTVPYSQEDLEFPLFPEVEVNLSNCNGNAYALIGAVQKALRRAHAPVEALEEFRTEATSGDYDHVIQTCMRTVNVS